MAPRRGGPGGGGVDGGGAGGEPEQSGTAGATAAAAAAALRRKHSLGNLRRAHPASGATWNVQVVRGKMSSKCLWHACRALILGLTLMLLGAGMATIGYYADHLSVSTEVRANATIRARNELKGFHLNNFSYVGPIVMGFGGFIVVASCVMTFEARDSAAKVMPARLRGCGGGASTGSKSNVRSNQSSAASQRRAIGMQLQNSRWDQHFGVFRSSPADCGPVAPAAPTVAPLDREALTAEFIKFSKSLNASARFSPQLRRLTYGSVPNLSTHAPHPLAYSTNFSHLLSLNQKLLGLEHKRHHRHHHRHHRSTHHPGSAAAAAAGGGRFLSKSRGTRMSNSLVQRTTRESATCALLQPPPGRLYWHASSFDDSGRLEKQLSRNLERNRRSDTARRHVLARQRPIEHEEERDRDREREREREREKSSPLGNRRCSTMSESSYSGRWTMRCGSMASRSRTSSIDSRRIQVDLHSPEVMPKSILRSPKRYNSGPSATPSVDKEFRSQLSVCSEPPAHIHQLSGQSSLEPCFPEENADTADEKMQTPTADMPQTQPDALNVEMQTSLSQADEIARKPGSSILKKPRPDTLPLHSNTTTTKIANTSNGAGTGTGTGSRPAIGIVDESLQELPKPHLYRSNSSRTFYRAKRQIPKEFDDSIFYIRSTDRDASNANSNTNSTSATAMASAAVTHTSNANDLYDSLQVINERRSTLLKADSESSLLTERKLFSHTVVATQMTEIPERINEQPPIVDPINTHNVVNTDIDLERGNDLSLDTDSNAQAQHDTTIDIQPPGETYS